MEQFLNRTLVEILDVEVSVLSVFWILIVFVAAIALDWLVGQFVNRKKAQNRVVSGFAKRLLLFIHLFIWIGFINYPGRLFEEKEFT